MEYFEIEEKDIVKFQQGDQLSFEIIYNTNKEKLYQYALKYLKSPELAYDIVQDTFIKLWENRMQMLNKENIQGFLFITAKNSSISYLRRAAVDRNAREKILESYIFSSSSDTEYYTIDREYANYIAKVLADMPAQTQLVFKKCRFDQLSYEEVSKELGISKNTVKKHMMRALKTFREDEVIKNMSANTLIMWFFVNF